MKQITFCTDNDKAGREFAYKYQYLMPKDLSSIKFPKEKDWNDDLKEIQRGKYISSPTKRPANRESS